MHRYCEGGRLPTSPTDIREGSKGEGCPPLEKFLLFEKGCKMVPPNDQYHGS